MAANALLGLAGVVLRSPHPERLVAFYRDALGLALSEEASTPREWVGHAGESTLIVQELGTLATWAPVTLLWDVDDADALAATLSARGIRVEVGPMSADHRGRADYHRWCQLADPDGNRLSLQSIAADWKRDAGGGS